MAAQGAGGAALKDELLPTELLYHRDANKLGTIARIVSVTAAETVDEVKGMHVVCLDKTVFHPQGGGQLADIGTITFISETDDNDEVILEWNVSDVRLSENGVVLHMGKAPCPTQFVVGATVALRVSKAERDLHRRLHTAGHVISLAARECGLPFTEVSGRHFPDGPNVMFQGVVDSTEKESARAKLEDAANAIVAAAFPVAIDYVGEDQLDEKCAVTPVVSPGRDTRVITVQGHKGHACGGTHVDCTSDIGKIIISKLTAKKGTTKASYTLEDLSSQQAESVQAQLHE